MSVLNQEFLDRFNGVINLYGRDKVEKFVQSRVLVIGLGGVGSWIAESLARSGIGTLLLMDLDDVCISNINRQLLALTSTLGESKVEVMSNRCRDINNSINIIPLEYYITADNIEPLIRQYQPDVIVDAIDNFRIKAALIAKSIELKTPLITIGSSGGKTDPTQVIINDLARTEQDPLLAKVKSLLRQNYGMKKITGKRKFKVSAIFSTEPIKRSNRQITSCVSFGSVNHLTSTYGNFAAYHVLQHLSN